MTLNTQTTMPDIPEQSKSFKKRKGTMTKRKLFFVCNVYRLTCKMVYTHMTVLDIPEGSKRFKKRRKKTVIKLFLLSKAG